MTTPTPVTVSPDQLVNEYVTLDAIMRGPDYGKRKYQQQKWYARIRYDDETESQVSVYGDQLTILKAAGFNIGLFYEAPTSRFMELDTPLTVIIRGERALIRIRAAKWAHLDRWATHREFKAVRVGDTLYTSQDNRFEKILALRWESEHTKVATVTDGTYEYDRTLENNRDGYVVVSREV